MKIAKRGVNAAITFIKLEYIHVCTHKAVTEILVMCTVTGGM